MIDTNVLFFLILISFNIITAKTIREDTKIIFTSTLTEADDEIVNINDEFKKPKLTFRRQTTQDKHPKQGPCNQKGKTYCEDPPDYPAEEIRKLLAKSKINITAFNVDLDVNDTLSNIDLANRIDVRNQEPLCLSRSTALKKPMKAETEEGEWLFVAEGQVVVVDECITPDQPCEILPNMLQAKCEQKYLLRKLYAYDDKDKKEIREVKFKFPSCCMCMVYGSQSVSRRRRRNSLRTFDNERAKRNARGINPDFAYPDQLPIIEKPSIENRFRSNNINCTEQFGTLCTKVENYPKDIIANLRKKGVLTKSPLYGEDETSIAISTRTSSDAESGVPMCGVQSRILWPEAAKTINNENKFVIQDKESGFVQGIFVEYCAVNDTPCNFADQFPPNYVTKCQQMYIFRQVDMIDNTGKRGPDLIQIPSCCACHVSRETSMITKS